MNDIHIKVEENEMRANAATAQVAAKKSNSNEQSKTGGESGSAGRDSGQGLNKDKAPADNLAQAAPGATAAEYNTNPAANKTDLNK